MYINDKPLRTAPNNLVRKAAFMPVVNRRVPFALTRGQTIYFNLGGTIEEGESPEQTVVRECLEEANIVLDPSSVRLIHALKEDYCYGFVPGTKFEMYLFDGSYAGVMVPSSEIVAIDWFSTADKHRTTPMGGIILDWFAAQGLID